MTWLKSYEARLTPRERNLVAALEGLVPLFVLDMRGWTFEQRRASVDVEAVHLCDTLLCGRGDGKLLTRADHAEAARSLNAIARGLAVLSYSPGGVTLFGRHWCTAPHCGCPHRPRAVCDPVCPGCPVGAEGTGVASPVGRSGIFGGGGGGA